MRALQVVEPNGPDAVVLSDIPEPEARDGLFVKVEAAGVGFPDLLMSRGEFQIRQQPPFTLGWEAAGVVVQAPEGSALRPGQRVATLSFGSYAEIVAAVPEATFALPAALSFAEGAAFPLNYLTALAGLQRRGRLQAGETLLVHGAAGGAGLAAVQVGKALGARVFAVVSSEQKAALARAAGADEVFMADGDWRAQALEASGGVNVVFDPVGGDRFKDSLRSLAPEGRLVVIGFAAGAIPEVAVNRLLLRNVDVCGCTWSVLATAPGGIASAAHQLDAMVESGHVRPHVGELLPLADAPAALRALDERRAVGKSVLAVAG